MVMQIKLVVVALSYSLPHTQLPLHEAERAVHAQARENSSYCPTSSLFRESTLAVIKT